jgi:hypothetical protein
MTATGAAAEVDIGRRSWADSRLYGWSAWLLGLFLLWFAVWTIECNALVLTGQHYSLFLWAPVPPTLLVLLALPFRRAVIATYALDDAARSSAVGRPDLAPLDRRDWAMLAGGALVALAAADIGNRLPTAIPYMVACAVVAAAMAFVLRRHGGSLLPPAAIVIGWRLPALIVLLYALYYFSHRIDGDDANFINMAIGAQRTHGAVYQFDTMLGDGPNPIHLPTYKFHAFELLGAVLSSYTGLEPIAVFHLLIPALLLPLLALVLMTTLAPAAGRYWLAAALFWLAFLFVNEVSIGGWGLHGIVRFYQGKGFLVSALLPLCAALALRWMTLGRRVDLLALFLADICSIGFSANGLYGAPAAMGLVAAAVVCGAPRSPVMWRRLLLLSVPCLYSVVVAALIVVLHLAFPSEQMTPTFAIDQLNFVTYYGIPGRLALAAFTFVALGLLPVARPRAALLYFPLAMLLTLNPVSWHAISAISGNLGFRIFWSIPMASLVALAAVAAIRLAGVRSELTMSSIGGMALLGSVGFLATNHNPVTTIRWHRPDLKVIRPDYELAQRLAARTRPGCRILAPEQYAMLLSMIRGAPHPVFVRELYLIHYRFTLPHAEIALRERLRQVVDGTARAVPPSPATLAAFHLPIGTVAVNSDAPSWGAAAALASNLHLMGPSRDGPLLIWQGACHAVG